MGTKQKPPKPLQGQPRMIEEQGLPERWSAQRKAELVLRLLRCEALDAVSRANQPLAHELESASVS